MGDPLRHRDGSDWRQLDVTEEARVDALLASAFDDLSRARIQRLIATGNVLLNGEPVRKSARACPGDRLAVSVPPTDHERRATNLTFAVIYEDDSLLAIDKPAGVAVHGAPGDTSATVAAWFVEHYPGEAAAFDAERPGIVHRLDKGTSGVLLLAKTPISSAALSAAFESRSTRKEYVAICDGVPSRVRAVIEAPITRHPGDRTRMAIGGGGRDATTEYEVLGTRGERAVLLVHPITGRTHQIRVHLAAIGAPVTADRTYGRSGDGRHLLHAWRLCVPHPAGGSLVVTAPLPRDMRDEIRTLGLEHVALPYCEPVPAARTEESC